MSWRTKGAGDDVVMYDYLSDFSSFKSFDSILNTDYNTKSNILNTNIINI